MGAGVGSAVGSGVGVGAGAVVAELLELLLAVPELQAARPTMQARHRIIARIFFIFYSSVSNSS